MVDTKKSDAASEETERPDENIVEDAQTKDEAQDSEDVVSEETPLEDSDAIEDVEIIEEAIEEVSEGEPAPTDDFEAEAQAEPDTDGMEAEELAEPEDPQDVTDLETMDGVEHVETPADTEEAAAKSTEPEPPITEVPHTIEKETVVVERRGAIVPGFFGGALAAVGLLFAAPYVVPAKFMPANPEVKAALQSQGATITALQAEIDMLEGKLAETASSSALATVKDESQEVKAALDELAAGIASGEALSNVTSQIGALADRMGVLEKRPLDDSPDPASIAAVEAYGRELAQLRETVTAQMAAADALVKSAAAAADEAVREALDASSEAIADATATEEAAREKALRAAQAQALVDIQAALENGSSFAGTLPMLDGIEIPAVLEAAAADGVTTLSELQKAYTVAARQALSVSRSETTPETPGARASTWLQNQLGVRSLVPSDGDDPDAVLSRAEAAVAEARLTDAIAELSALPEGGQQIMADWMALAAARAEALAAANELAASLATN
ncbi:hypothetical protein [Aliiruegeria sabulilitoris]|uniref:hypothetical protein n=1 Tax=Aliiruegeria sabulilitoris TaxID=1510458 RepID=UPI00082FDC14|nr:hypothetical protein [Aliiruegeria sabulilitoris]NDR57609.1 hypothetical protein [Pseudoruegeria sp. M32A2M]